MKPAKVKILFTLLGLIIIIFFASKFFIDKKDSQITFNKGSRSDTVLDTYLTANQKVGQLDVTTTMPPITKITETAKFWINDQQFRIDYFTESGEKRMSIISEDGKKAYFCDPKHSLCYPTGLPIEQYLLAFYLPSDNLELLPENENEKDCQQVRYTVQETFSSPEGPNPYYVEDITYCITENTLVGFTTRDALVEDDGSLSSLLTNDFTIKQFDTKAEIEDDQFKLLYPIGKDPEINN